MRRRAGTAGVLVCLALLVLVQSSGGGLGAEPEEEPAWWDEDRPFRIIVDDEGPIPLPGDLSGRSSSLLAADVVFSDVLDRAGWPSTVELAPDPGTIAVVAYDSRAPGAEPGQPLPRRVLDPLDEAGTCKADPDAACAVVWEEVPTALAYGIYWAPTDRSVSDPQTGAAPRLVGHVQGHEHWIAAEGLENPRLLGLPGFDVESSRLESLGRGGWTVLEPGEFAQRCDLSAEQGGCVLDERVYRLFVEDPASVVLHDVNSQGQGPSVRAASLVGPAGSHGEELSLSLPQALEEPARVAVWPHAGSCASACSVDVGTERVEVQEGGASTALVDAPTDDRLLTVSAGETVHAGTVAAGLAHIEPRNVQGTEFIVPTHDRMTIVANGTATLEIRSLSTGERLAEDFTVSGVRSVPVDPDHDIVEVLSSAPIQVYAGSASAGVDHHQPIPVADPTLVPAEARLYAIAPSLGAGSYEVSLSQEDDGDRQLRMPAGSIRVIQEDQIEASPIGVQTRAPLGLLSTRVTDEDETPILGQALSVVHPQRAGILSASYRAPVAGLEVEPPSRFAGAGTVASFNVTLTNLARGSDGQAPSLSLDLDVNPVGVAEELDIETTIGAPSVRLDGRFGAQKTVPLHVRVPDDVADKVLSLEVEATSKKAPQLGALDEARISVVTIRDFELTFEDGSTSQTRTSEPGGQTVFPLLAENTGTVPLDLEVSQEVLGDERFTTCLQAASGGDCSSAVPLAEVAPGEARELELVVGSPDVDEEARVDVRLRGELASGHGPVRNAEATVLLNVPVAAELTLPEKLELPPGGETRFPITVENLGLQTQARLSSFASEASVTSSLLEDGENVEELQTLLGPEGTDRAVWETSAVVAVSENATPGQTTQGRFLLELEPGGGLAPFRNVSSVPVQVVRVFDNVSLEAAVDPGLANTLEVPLEIPELRDSQVGLRAINAPPRWRVDVPANLFFDAEGRTILEARVEPPPGEAAGPGTVVLGIDDPLGAGGALELETEVSSGGAARMTGLEPVSLAVGDQDVLETTVRNVGNQPLEGQITTEDPRVNLSSAFLSLAPEESTTVPVSLTARRVLEGNLTLRFLDGNRQAGEASVHVRAENASLHLGRASGELAGDRVLVNVLVENQATVPVRNLTLELVQDGEAVQQRSVREVPANRSMPVPLEWVPPDTVEVESLSVRLHHPSLDEGLQTTVEADDPAQAPLVSVPVVSTILALVAARRGRSARGRA